MLLATSFIPWTSVEWRKVEVQDFIRRVLGHSPGPEPVLFFLTWKQLGKQGMASFLRRLMFPCEPQILWHIDVCVCVCIGCLMLGLGCPPARHKPLNL